MILGHHGSEGTLYLVGTAGVRPFWGFSGTPGPHPAFRGLSANINHN